MILYVSSVMMLAALGADATRPQSPDPQEIVVTAQRLKRIRVDAKRDRKSGLHQCRVRRTSGDSGLDAAFCDAVLECAKAARGRAEMEACLVPRIAEIATNQGLRPRAVQPD